MADVITQVGEIYKGWRILGIRQGPMGGTYYKVKCKCGYEVEYLGLNLLKKYNDKGCKKCTDTSRRMFKKGDIVGNFEIMDSGTRDIRKQFVYTFRCLSCNYESLATANKRISRPGCKYCYKRKSLATKIEIGAVFGLWTVIKRIKNTSGNIIFLCMCACGITRHLVPTSLVNRKSTGCAKCTGKRAGCKKRFEDSEKPKPHKLAEYNNPYLNFCITPKTMDEIIEHFSKPLEEIQDVLMDLMLDEKIEQNKDLLWETI